MSAGAALRPLRTLSELRARPSHRYSAMNLRRYVPDSYSLIHVFFLPYPCSRKVPLG
jgi:hypothetical protein